MQLNSAVYGTDFMSSFGTAMLSSVVNLAAADFQNEIGDIFANGANGGEGSLGHMLLHSGLGCVTSSITGGNCAAGAAGGLIQSVYAGAIQDGEPTRDQYESDEAFNTAYGEWSSFHLNMVSMLGGIGGYVFSGGEAQNVNIASSVAQSGLQNNYLSHTEIANFKKELLECSQNQSADCSEILNRYLQLSQDNNAALIACGDDAACLLPHLMRIAAAEASGAAEDLLFGMSGHQYGFYQGAFTSLQEEGISLVQDVQISQAELDQLTIEQHKREFVNLQCGGQLDDACSAAFDEELTRIEEDNAYRRQVTEEFFESIGVLLDFTPVGDVLGIIDGCGSLGYSCAMAVGVTVLGPVADAAKIVTRVGDDLVDAAGNIYKKLDGSDTFTDINGNSFQLDNNGDLVRVEMPDVSVNSVPDVPEGIPYFRVQGGGSGNATSRDALTVNPDGSVSITPGCTGSICVSVEGPDHAAYYITNKRPDGSVVVFDVDRDTHNQIMDNLVPQQGNSGAGVKLTDTSTPGTSIELDHAFSELMTNGSSNGRVLTEQEFLDEFDGN